MLSWGCDEQNFVVSKHSYNMILKLSAVVMKTYCSAFVAKLHFYISLNYWAGRVICLQFWTEYFAPICWNILFWFVGTFCIDLLQHFVLICCNILFSFVAAFLFGVCIWSFVWLFFYLFLLSLTKYQCTVFLYKKIIWIDGLWVIGGISGRWTGPQLWDWAFCCGTIIIPLP
jgi:hypothetical protein